MLLYDQLTAVGTKRCEPLMLRSIPMPESVAIRGVPKGHVMLFGHYPLSPFCQQPAPISIDEQLIHFAIMVKLLDFTTAR